MAFFLLDLYRVHGEIGCLRKSSPQKVQEYSSRKCSFIPNNPAESAGIRPAESALYEYVPIVANIIAVFREFKNLINLSVTLVANPG